MTGSPTARRRASCLLTLIAAACTPIGAPLPPDPAPRPAPEPVGVEPRAPERDQAAPPAAAPTVVTDAAPVPRVRPVRSFAEVRGLWVVRWTMTSERQVRDMVAAAADAGFNTLIVQVRGRGDAYYRSALEPRAEGIQGPPDFDPLALAIEEGHRRGMAVHAWLNTHLVWGPAALPQSPEHLVHAHPDWLAVPRTLARELYAVDPRSPRYVAALSRYAADRPETVEGLYTSPSHPEVRARVRAVWADLVSRYDLDGMHFDYIRFPSPEFDYSAGALTRFRAWAAPRVPAARAAELDRAARSDPLAWATGLPRDWDEFRRQQITSLVEEIYRDVKSVRPELVVSAAVVPDRTTALDVRFQEWERWIAEGFLDVAVPMVYTASGDQFAAQVGAARLAVGSRDRVWAGIGAYLNTPDGTIAKIDAARGLDAGGVVLFSYDWLVGEGRGAAGDPALARIARARFQPADR
ncbi:MAG: glycoside hydrolase family 10 protein [Gemmatimonadales bacterium]